MKSPVIDRVMLGIVVRLKGEEALSICATRAKLALPYWQLSHGVMIVKLRVSIHHFKSVLDKPISLLKQLKSFYW